MTPVALELDAKVSFKIDLSPEGAYQLSVIKYLNKGSGHLITSHFIQLPVFWTDIAGVLRRLLLSNCFNLSQRI